MAEIKGEGGLSGFSIMIGLMILFSFWLVNNGPNSVSHNTSVTTSLNKIKTSTFSQSLSDSDGKSTYSKNISIQASSVYTDSPNKEYITLSAHGNKQPINISGWTLKNGRDKKNYVVSGQTVRGQSVMVKIPESGVELYNPWDPNSNIHKSITLKSGERAIIVTGSLPTLASVKIEDNFKINRCLGYIEDHPINRGNNYQFTPGLRYNCPVSRDLPSVSELDDTCYNFVRSIAGCHEPTDIYDETDGYCLDRNCKLSSACRTFVKQNFNPQICFKLYSADKNFVGSEWRVYLNRNWELWERQRETISLYDRDGLLINEISY